jgi:hypothetical protein
MHRYKGELMKFSLAALAAAVAAATAIGLGPPAHADGDVMYRVGVGIALSPVSQQNAVSAAEDYLKMSAFSRQGLIEQLEYEGYSTSDATFAVDHITVDWNQQAVRAAKEYLKMSAFSRSGLIEQLEYEGFTSSQAVYGVAGTGL